MSDKTTMALLEFYPVTKEPDFILGENDFVIINQCEGYTNLVQAHWDEDNKFICFYHRGHDGFQNYFDDYYALWARLPSSLEVLAGAGII